MAIPASGDEAGHGTFEPVVGARANNKALRVAAVGAAVILACAAVVALVGVQTQTKTELVIVQPRANLDQLADFFLANGGSMSPQQALQQIKSWNAGASPASLKAVGAKTQQLDGSSYQAEGSTPEMSLASKSLLCEKRAKIIDLFDRLLKKLGGEELSANITMGKVTKEWNDALSGWLDSESKYRLTVEKAKEAKAGSEFARNDYEKWNTAYKKAKQDLVMRYIGVLHDVKATEKSIAAGGRDSTIDKETGVSDPYATQKKAINAAKLASKVQKLKALVLKTKLPGATQKLAQIEQLPVYSETEEVAKILKEMLDDLATRLSVIDEVDAQAQKLVDDAYAKMVEWEKKLVALGNGESPLSLCAYVHKDTFAVGSWWLNGRWCGYCGVCSLRG